MPIFTARPGCDALICAGANDVLLLDEMDRLASVLETLNVPMTDVCGAALSIHHPQPATWCYR